ncbi:major facilitator superfamily domain containing 12 [Nesidiocoris tenuis]|uniref:Major facilitator superfamily domain containing 12 n=1 Tax=Nesidiocoris tenuis TaxID=355587 RepID=A0ABN7AFF9_9HEMI|nr:major facilitator superfamily domain containing 12 [Nesidiocoris tenuis]
MDKKIPKDGIDFTGDEMVLPWITRAGYGVGHVLNDLCSAMWFLYFLMFLTHVDGMSDRHGAIVLLIGQIADALATPVIGVWSDRGSLGCLSRIGKRRSWYLLGTLAVMVTMPFLYSPPIGVTTVGRGWMTLYYSFFVVIFQFGWAAVQTVHLALATDLTPLESERTLLLSLRNTFTSICTLLVPSLFFLIQIQSLNNISDGSEITAKDAYQFEILVGGVLALGFVSSTFSGFTMKERTNDESDSERLTSEGATAQMERRTYLQIFSKLDLYKVALLYTSTRLFGNILQTFVALYVSETMQLSAVHVSAVPLAVYSASTISSIMAERMINLCGRKVTYAVGMLPGVAASVWMYLGPMSMDKTYFTYSVCCIYGVAASILLVTAISQTTVFIGLDIGNGAFVFGLMSFCDKLICGIAILCIQNLKPAGHHSLFYKDALAFTCGASAIVGTMAILSIFLRPTTEVTERTNQETPEA